MTDAWTDRLSEYVDGLMDAAERRALEAHLEGCAQCREIEVDLRRVIVAARSAPVREPARDLWPVIAAGMAAGSVTPARHGTGRTARRRFSFTMPQLAAAAVVLVTISGAAVWLVRGTDRPTAVQGTIVQSADVAPSSVQTVSTVPDEQYTDELADLESVLEQYRTQLDPTTVDVIERSLEVIDDAIADARSAIEADPGNQYLHRQLDNTMRKKLDILRRATRVQRASS